MQVRSPAERVYYYECSYGKYRLTHHIPVEELESLKNKRMINEKVLEDFPDGVDLRVNETDYQDFFETYGYKPEVTPEEAKTLFYAILSSTKDWRKFRGADLISAKILEAKPMDIEKSIDTRASLMKISPEELRYVARSDAETTQEALEAYRKSMKHLHKEEEKLDATLRRHTPKGIDPSKNLGKQGFKIEYAEGDSVEKVISRIQRRRGSTQ